jgi:site-specific recombinase XerD
MITIRQSKEKFLNNLKTSNYSKKSLTQYDYALEKFLEYVISKYKIATCDDFNNKNICDFLKYIFTSKSKRTGKVLSENTKYSILRCMKNYFSFLNNYDYINQDFEPLFEMKYKKETLIDNILDEKDISQIFNAMSERTHIDFRDKTIFELMYNTGIRKSEVTNLDVYDIDFDQKYINIRQGKNKKDRRVPFGDYLEKYLREYNVKVRPALLIDNQDEIKLFINAEGKALKPRGLAAIIEKYSALTGIKFTCHTFRHSTATHLLKHGMSSIYLQKLLGHECLSTTQIYTKIYPKDLKKLVLGLHPRQRKDIKNMDIPVPEKRVRIFNFDEAEKRLEKCKK